MTRIHLVRHGKVDNPDGILYGRLPGYGLSAAGRESAGWAAERLASMTSSVDAVWSSPLQRTLESAEPIAAAFGRTVEPRDGLIESFNHLQGGRYKASLRVVADPTIWRYLVNPFKPSWGEPFREVANRMVTEVRAAAAAHPGGEVVLVSHELPIWMVHRVATGRPMFHDPRKRRCALSSITTFEVAGESIREVGYWERPST